MASSRKDKAVELQRASQALRDLGSKATDADRRRANEAREAYDKATEAERGK